MSSPEPMGLIEDIMLPASDAPAYAPVEYPLHVYVSRKHVFLGEGSGCAPRPRVAACYCPSRGLVAGVRAGRVDAVDLWRIGVQTDE